MAFWYVGEEKPHSIIIWSIGICFCIVKKKVNASIWIFHIFNPYEEPQTI
jgi:hypothetical protein